jgi:SAM-dependent methyltransferase
MGIYHNYILPRMIHWVCSSADISVQRRKIIPMAKGRVLEIGMGSGLNFPFYDPGKIDFIWGLENNCADTVVVTYTLCSIPDVARALQEMHRVLRPGGELIFCEHGRSPDLRVVRWQDRLTPAWKVVSGGCHLNRPIPDLIRGGGFKIRHLEMQYTSPLKPVSFNYWGFAGKG